MQKNIFNKHFNLAFLEKKRCKKYDLNMNWLKKLEIVWSKIKWKTIEISNDTTIIILCHSNYITKADFFAAVRLNTKRDYQKNAN